MNVRSDSRYLSKTDKNQYASVTSVEWDHNEGVLFEYITEKKEILKSKPEKFWSLYHENIEKSK